MSDHHYTSASSSNRNTTIPTAMSCIDWTIFKDGEEDTFGWLLHSNAAISANTNSGIADIATVNMASEFLPVTSIDVDHNLAGGSAVVKLQNQVDNAAIAAAGLVAQSTAPALVPQLRRNPRDLSSTPTVSPTPEFLNMRHFENESCSVNGSCKSSGVENKKEVNTSTCKLEVKQGCSVFPAQTTRQKVHTSTRSTRVKCKASASIVAKSKRPLQRKKSGAQSLSTANGYGFVKELEKKQIRRVKNLVSVREFRKRKTKQLEQNEARLRKLEAENMDLKMRLKIGKEAILGELREKKQIKEQMRQMLQQNANEQEIAQFLNMYKVTYSDYGPKRREKLQFHLSRIRELLLPTQVTKLSLYSVEQGVDMLRRDHTTHEDPMSASDPATATMSLWGVLADELEVSDEQQRQILERRAAIKKVRDDLNHTLGIVKKLEEVTDEKNTALEAQVAQLQRILTPSQATKFIIWVKENPAFMYMLDKLVDSTLHNNSNCAEE